MKKKEETTNNNESKLNWIDNKFAIANVNNYSDSCTFFNLYAKSAIGNIALYGCKVVSSDGHDDFIAFPARKNGDKFYNECSVIFDDGIQEKIIAEVAKLI